MKTSITVLSIGSLIMLSLNSMSFAQDNFILKGKIGNWSKPAKIFIAYNDLNRKIIDSVDIHKGAFVYQGRIDDNTTKLNFHLSTNGSSFDQSQYHYTTAFQLKKGVTTIKGKDFDDAVENITREDVDVSNYELPGSKKQQPDSVKGEVKIGFSIGRSDKETKYPRFFGGITLSRIDWGFSRPMDNGSFHLSEDNQFMSYKKASNFGFDLLQVGLRFNDNFKTYLSTGFEWNYTRLEQNILLSENTVPISYDVVDRNDVDYKKNVFTTTYLRVPLSFEWRSNKLASGERIKVAFGAMTGILLKGTQRLKSDQNGKQKFKDNYGLATFQYGPFVRIGYDDFGLFAKYYINDTFEQRPADKGLNNLAFGLTLGF